MTWLGAGNCLTLVKHYLIILTSGLLSECLIKQSIEHIIELF